MLPVLKFEVFFLLLWFGFDCILLWLFVVVCGTWLLRGFAFVFFVWFGFVCMCRMSAWVDNMLAYGYGCLCI